MDVGGGPGTPRVSTDGLCLVLSVPADLHGGGGAEPGVGRLRGLRHLHHQHPQHVLQQATH